MNVVFVPEARDEFLDAIAYYEEARCGEVSAVDREVF